MDVKKIAAKHLNGNGIVAISIYFRQKCRI